MNIVRENMEDLTTLLKVTVGEADYNEAVDKSLRTYRRKANIPGFRPGMVPMSIINKMYRKGVVAEEAYRTASKACFDYIETEKLTTVGDMIPSQKQQPLDFDNDTEYEFVFEVGIAPEVQISLSKKDKVTKYTIRVEEKMREGYRSNFLRRFGRLVDVEKVEKEEALDVTLEQGDTKIEEAYVGLSGMSDEDRAPFVGKKVGDTMDVDIAKLYKTPSQRASVLGVKEAELEGMDPNYRLTITKIRKFAEPELNEEFFKTAFPDGGVKTAEEFEQYVTRQIEGDLARESGFLFSIDVHKFLLKKAALVMPEAFLKNWLYTINEGKFSMEDIDKDFDQFLKMFTWNYLQKHFIKQDNLSVTKEEALAEAKSLAAAQFAQYGMPSAPEDMLAGYAEKILADKDQGQKIYEKLYEVKVVEDVKSKVKVTEKAVSADDFAKLAKEL